MIAGVSIGPEDGIPTLNSVVLSYLVHHGYGRTASAFANATKAGGDAPSAREGMPMALQLQLIGIAERRSVCALILDGRVEDAIGALSRTYVGLLDGDPRLLFRLRCRQFVELVRELSQQATPAASDEVLARTMQWGQQLQDHYALGLSTADQATLFVRARCARLVWAPASLLRRTVPLTPPTAGIGADRARHRKRSLSWRTRTRPRRRSRHF